jgi:hypothetical protein
MYTTPKNAEEKIASKTRGRPNIQRRNIQPKNNIAKPTNRQDRESPKAKHDTNIARRNNRLPEESVSG